MAESSNRAVLSILDGLRCGSERCQCFRPLSSGGGLTHCPAHPDANPSLSVGCPDRTAWPLLHCFAGCSHKAVTTALRERGLLPRETGFTLGMGRHVRYDSPNGSKRFRWEGGAAPKASLYRVDALDALPDQSTVLVCEGESAAEAAVSLGLQAVATVTGAATAPNPEAFQPLARFDVVLVPDAHALGSTHMDRCAEAASRAGVSVRILTLPDVPEGGDLADWRGTPEQLRDLVAAAPAWVAPERSSTLVMGDADEPVLAFETAREFADDVSERVEWLLPGYLARGAITEIGGKVKRAGKTTFVLAACAATVKGQPFIGRETSPCPVVYLTEQAGSSFREALRRAGLLEREDFHILRWSRTVQLPWEDVASGAAAHCARVGAGLLIVDTLGQFARIDGDAENSSGAALAAMRPLQEAAARHNVAVAVVRHERKSGGDVGDSTRGSSAFAGAVDIVVALRRVEGSTTAENVRVLHALSRYDETPSELAIELLDDGTYRCVGDASALTARLAKETVLAALPMSEADAAAVTTLGEGARVARAALYDACRELFAEGLICRKGDGRKGSPFLYWRPVEVPN